MTKTKIGDSEWLLVDVPEWIKKFEFSQPDLYWRPVYPHRGGQTIITNSIPLPPENNYTLIGKPTQLSESDWEKIVDEVFHLENFEELVNDGWWDYDQHDTPFDTATESGLSWIRSLNLDPDKVVILKIENV